MDPFQKLCHSETRKLVLVIGIIISTVIAIQFFLPQYENVLAHLFPTDNADLHAKNSSLPGDFSPNPVLRSYNGPPSNHSSTNSSLVDGVVNKTSSGAFELGEETKNETTGDDGEKDRSVSALLTLPPVISPTDLSILKELYSGPAMSPMAGEPGLRPSVPAMPPDAEKPGLFQSGVAMPPNAENPGLLQSSTIIPPVADKTGLLQGVSVIMPPKAENPGLLQIAPAKPPNAENPQLLQSSPDTSNNKSSMSTTNIKKARVKVPSKVMSLSEMNALLLQSHASSGSTRPQWSSLPDQEILSAKSQIENAPMIKNDQELYAPLFRNASMFKKSYELMEQKLKVFIYSEGARPIFHQPILGGIYASEGWFMKLMESNKHFVVKDPKKAHLFYLPFSSQILRYTLYIPDSHSRKKIVKYLKNYMSIITTKYPFWNRTGGADHFLVACHDWAPSETDKAMSGSIRALCNADVNEAGGFRMGKDVSLPEANVRSVSNPLKDLGGKPASKRTILAFFAGRAHGHFRQILLKHWENKDPNMKIYNGTNTRVNSKNYIQYMQNSKYCICPKGYEVNSPRVVEAIFFECVPVIISDNFVPPFFNVLDWETFAVFVPEKDIPKLKIILDSIPEQKYLELQKRVKKAQQHFLWHTKPVKYDMFHMILHSIWYNRVFQMTLLEYFV